MSAPQSRDTVSERLQALRAQRVWPFHAFEPAPYPASIPQSIQMQDALQAAIVSWQSTTAANWKGV